MPGDSVRLRDVARQAGVSIASASRALANHPDATEALRLRVTQAAASLGYVPNMVARGLRRRASMTVGVLASDIANPLITGIFRGAEHVLAEAGYSMFLTDSHGDPASDGRRLALLRQRQVDGVILLPVTEDDPGTLAFLARGSMPAVVVDRELPAGLPVDYVLSDHAPGIRQAARHLVALGHRHLALVTGRDVRPARAREAALAAELQVAGCPPPLVLPGTLSERHGHDALARLRALDPAPSAVILGGNQLLMGALGFVRAQGLALGRDLSLVTCDDIPLGRLLETPVAAVARDIFALGEAAAHQLLRRLHDPPGAAAPTMLPTWFVPGASCGAPRRHS